MFTRQQYLNKECTHRQYYAQFVTQGIIDRVLRGIGKEKIINSTDEHLNDIPLQKWDCLLPTFPSSIANKMRECGDHPTLAGAVCICKEAARQIQEEV